MQLGSRESSSPNNQQLPSFLAFDMRGKHRIQAELKRLEQEVRFIEEELEQLEITEKPSTVCEEVVNNVENIPDPLLPETRGPINPVWDWWFEGPQESKGCRCWML